MGGYRESVRDEAEIILRRLKEWMDESGVDLTEPTVAELDFFVDEFFSAKFLIMVMATWDAESEVDREKMEKKVREERKAEGGDTV